jgi:deoxyhypusine synthase
MIDDGFQAFNAARLSEACRIFSDKMLDPGEDTTVGLTIAGAMTPAGIGGCVVEMMDRGLVRFHHQHRRQPVSRPAPCA